MAGHDQDLHCYTVYPLIDKPGLKCTASISPISEFEPIEIQINFFGTIDFAAKVADMEKGGPGQQTLKIYERKLLEQVNSLIEQMSILHPEKELRLRLSGHSLGGALAKGFAHSIQRALLFKKITLKLLSIK